LINFGGGAVTRRRTVLAACLAALTLLIGGCTEKKPANQTLPSTSRSSASSSADALPPLGPADFPMPAEARHRNADGVIAFSKYYFALSNHLLKTLESRPLRELSHNCQVCDELADSYDTDRAAGYRYEGGELSISSTGSALVSGNQAEISFALQQAAVTVRDRSGAVVASKSSEAYSLSGGMAFNWDGARSTWVVTQLDAERI
jgi:hypothetical protein